MENIFATFEPVELKSSPSKEDIARYYSDNNITLDDDYLNEYFGLGVPQKKSSVPTSPTPKLPKYSISELLSSPTYLKPKLPTYSPIVDKDATERAKEIMGYFMDKGLTKEQAAGIAGNLHAESGLNTGALGDSGNSFGIAQWNKSRKNNLKTFAKSKGTHEADLQTQLDFLWHELMTTENSALQSLLTAKTATDAARNFADKFERMAKYNIQREQMANYYFNQP